MKTIPLFKIQLTLFFSVLMMLVACSPEGAKQSLQPEIRSEFCSPLSVYLHNNQVTEKRSDIVIERGITQWKADTSLNWEVEIPEAGDYEVYLIASVGGRGYENCAT